jgi:hypothetical protein
MSYLRFYGKLKIPAEYDRGSKPAKLTDIIAKFLPDSLQRVSAGV